VAPTDTCIAGECVNFTCEAADKNRTWNFQTGLPASGWTFGSNWYLSQEQPWTGGNFYPSFTAPATYSSDLTMAVTPAQDLAACSQINVVMDFYLKDEDYECGTMGDVKLQCGSGSSWTTLQTWSEISRDAVTEINQQNLSIDADACNDNPVQFRIRIENICFQGVSRIAFDNFRIEIP
jgi:hypothetical protein